MRVTECYGYNVAVASSVGRQRVHTPCENHESSVKHAHLSQVEWHNSRRLGKMSKQRASDWGYKVQGEGTTSPSRRSLASTQYMIDLAHGRGLSLGSSPEISGNLVGPRRRMTSAPPTNLSKLGITDVRDDDEEGAALHSSCGYDGGNSGPR